MSYILFDSDDKLDFDNLIIGNSIIYNNNNKYYLYYLNEKPKEIYIKLPSIRLIYNYKNNKYNQIKLPVYPLWEKIKLFIKMIKTIEKNIKKVININKIFISCLEKKENITTLKLDFTNNSSILSNIKNYNINGEIEGIISIPYIWENNEKYGLTIILQQVKYIANIDINNINFDDNQSTDNQYNIIKQNNISKYNNITNQLVLSEQINYKKIDNPNLIISTNILKEALSKLKKI